MKDKIKDIFKIKFIQDVGALQISTIITAVITIGISLIIAKGLKPTDFGIYNLALSLYALVGMFGNVGVKQMALVKLPSVYINQDREEILSIITYYFKVSLIVSVLIMIIGYIIAPYLSKFLYGRQDIGRFSRILFLMPPAIIIYKLIAVILEGTRNMKYLAILESTSALIRLFIFSTLIFLGLGLTILIYGWLFSAITLSILAMLIYNRLGLVKKGLPFICEIIKTSYSLNFWRFLRFNLSMGLSENIINLGDILPIMLLGMFVLPKEVGYFKLGYSVIGLSTVFLEPVARNLLIKFRQLKNNGSREGLHKAFYRVSLYTGIISVILITIIIVVYRFLIYFFLKDYKSSLKIVYILAIYFCLFGFGMGLSPILRALERLDIEIKINVIGILIFIALSLLMIKNLGMLGMAIALTLSGLFTKSVTYLSVRNLLKLES